MQSAKIHSEKKIYFAPSLSLWAVELPYATFERWLDQSTKEPTESHQLKSHHIQLVQDPIFLRLNKTLTTVI